MKLNVVFSVLLHASLLLALFFSRPGARKLEGYPVTIPVELVELKPVSYQAPEVQQVQPKVPEVQPEPKKMEGVALKKRKPPKPKPVEAPVKAPPEKKVEEPGKSAVAGKGVRLDVEEFPFSYYLALLQSRIQANWEPPFQSARAGMSRKVVVFFKIQRSGRITDLAIEASSGDYLFDQAALRAVTLANPLAPLPYDFPHSELGVHFEFEQGR